MALAPGTRLGVFEITAQIGEGGMGQVYRATDATLGRQVAIKILPEALASDPDRLARFQREAKVLASLNHPNIAAIYAVEKSAGMTALVMELVEGDDLSHRIARGAMPIDEVLPIARQTAEALAAAHEQGLVHRDLKPANIKVRADGQVKVLDFGLAKAMEPAGDSSPSASLAPTITTPAMTQVGMILGTAAYMSPEQAKGRPVDRRSDVWAFGAVLYEMLTGRRAFAGEDVSDTLASVLKDDPDWTSLPPDAPAALRRLLQRCLAKDRKARVSDIAVVLYEIDALNDGVPAPSTVGLPAAPIVSPSRRWAGRVATFAAGAAVAISLASVFGTVAWREGVDSAQLGAIRFHVQAPGHTMATGGPAFPPQALSRDGRHLAFALSTNQLAVKHLDSADVVTFQDVPSTSWPFWSPDGGSVGFFANGTLKQLDLLSGSARILAANSTADAGTWNAQGTILFGPGEGGGLYSMPEVGGAAQPVTTPDSAKGERSHHQPWFLPDGRHFLFLVLPTRQVMLGSLDDKTLKRELLQADSKVAYAGGYLVFIRNGTLLAQAFDPDRQVLLGEAHAIAGGTAYNGDNGRASFSASESALSYRSIAAQPLVWRGRDGKAGGTAADTSSTFQYYQGFDLSPDGRQIIAHRHTNLGGDLWLIEGERGTAQRFTTDETAHYASPAWSPDAKWIAYSTNQRDLLLRSIATGETRILVRERLAPQGGDIRWTPDSKAVLASVPDSTGGTDIWIFPVEGASPRPLVTGPFREFAASVSADGRWLAYQSNEAGPTQVFVAPFSNPSAKRQVSTDGGFFPTWRGTSELFFQSTDGWLNAAQFEFRADSLFARSITRLFRISPGAITNTINYRVTADGQRFLVPGGDADTPVSITFVQNWTTDLER